MENEERDRCNGTNLPTVTIRNVVPAFVLNFRVCLDLISLFTIFYSESKLQQAQSRYKHPKTLEWSRDLRNAIIAHRHFRKVDGQIQVKLPRAVKISIVKGI